MHKLLKNGGCSKKNDFLIFYFNLNFSKLAWFNVGPNCLIKLFGNRSCVLITLRTESMILWLYQINLKQIFYEILFVWTQLTMINFNFFYSHSTDGHKNQNILKWTIYRWGIKELKLSEAVRKYLTSACNSNHKYLESILRSLYLDTCFYLDNLQHLNISYSFYGNYIESKIVSTATCFSLTSYRSVLFLWQSFRIW